MPINSDLKICFVHIPKTGGTTIESIIPNILPNKEIGINPWDNQTENKQYLFGKNLQHLSINNIISQNPDVISHNFCIFTVVRNPYDRIVSMISWFNKRWIKKIDLSQNEFDIYINNLKQRWKNNKLYNHELPQNYFLGNDLSIFDYIIKLEKLNNNKINNLEKIMKLKNYDFNYKFLYQENIKLMKSNHFDSEYYFKNNKEARILVNEIYKDDFKILNYTVID